jgi:hypothetical protein
MLGHPGRRGAKCRGGGKTCRCCCPQGAARRQTRAPPDPAPSRPWPQRRRAQDRTSNLADIGGVRPRRTIGGDIRTPDGRQGHQLVADQCAGHRGSDGLRGPASGRIRASRRPLQRCTKRSVARVCVRARMRPGFRWRSGDCDDGATAPCWLNTRPPWRCPDAGHYALNQY